MQIKSIKKQDADSLNITLQTALEYLISPSNTNKNMILICGHKNMRIASSITYEGHSTQKANNTKISI